MTAEELCSPADPDVDGFLLGIRRFYLFRAGGASTPPPSRPALLPEGPRRGLEQRGEQPGQPSSILVGVVACEALWSAGANA